MHIGQFTNYYLPAINGVVRSVSAFRKSLMEMGHNVFVFSQEQKKYVDKEPFIFHYRSLSLPTPIDIPAAIPVSPFIDRLIPSLQLDIIHTHHPILLGQVAAKKAQDLELPLVFTFHTQYREYTHYVPIAQEIVQAFLKDAVHDWLQDFMRKCQHIIVPSISMRDILVRDYGLETNYTVIPTGIELEPFQKENKERARAKHGWKNDKVMVSVGRLAKEKNWSMFLKAAALSMKKHPKLRVVLLGDGPERQNLKDLAVRMGIGERVNFMGKVPFDEIPSYLKGADFFGFTSKSETQGLVTLEALAAGLPVVAVDASGTRDIIKDDVQGFLVDDEPNALAQAIDRLLSDQNLYHRFHEAAQDRAKEFEIKCLTKKLINVYEQAIQDKKDKRVVKITKS